MRKELHDAATVSSIPAMIEFGRSLWINPPQPGPDFWHCEALGMQIADALGDGDLKRLLFNLAVENQANIENETQEALYALCVVGPRELHRLRRYCDVPGHLGFHVAAQLAERAFLLDQGEELEFALHRLNDAKGVIVDLVDPTFELALAGAMFHFLRFQEFQQDRLQVAMKHLDPLKRQRAILDLGRLFGRFTYGGMASCATIQ